MPRRLLSLLAGCSVSAACWLAPATASRADEPKPTVLPAPMATAPGVADPAVLGAAPGMLADTGNGASNPWAQSFSAPPAPRVYFTGEYLMWWLKDSPQPVPLVTSVPAALVPVGNPNGIQVGSLLDPNAAVVLGGRNIDTGMRSGARFTLGTWLDDSQSLGVEGNYFFIAPTTITQSVAATGSASSPLLSIPFFDVTGQSTPTGLPGESARPIPAPPIFTRDFPSATPGETAAVFTQRLESQLQGFELNSLFGLSSLVNGNGLRLHALAGFRYLNLRESLGFSSAVNALPQGLDVFYNTQDQFTTRNDFYGGQVGLRGEYRLNRIVIQTTAKVAVGDVRQQVTINGATLTNLITGPDTPLLNYAGGIFAQPSSIGSHTSNCFSVLPQVDVNVGYQVCDWAQLFVGYSFLYLNNVVRPGNAIDRNINTTGIPFNTDPAGPALVPAGPAQPAFNFRDSTFWAQGINFGLQIRY